MPDASQGGAPFAIKAAPGGLLLVYFGYTNCPDICPGTLAGLKLAIHKLPAADARRVQVAMVTVDPTRDTPEAFTEYLANFFRDAHALRTEDPDQLQTLAEAFGVRYEVSNNAQGEEEVGHSALSFAVDDAGRIVDTWPYGFAERSIANDMKILLGRSAIELTCSAARVRADRARWRSPSRSLGAAACAGSSSDGGSGAVQVRDAWARSTGPGQATGVVYLRVVNDRDRSTTLTGARVAPAIARTAELHRGRVDSNGMATMHPLHALPVAAHTTHAFRTGGDHVMLVDLARPLRAGQRFRLVLTRRGEPSLHTTVAVRGS